MGKEPVEFLAHICPRCGYAVGDGHTQDLCDWNLQAASADDIARKLKAIMKSIERFDKYLEKLRQR